MPYELPPEVEARFWEKVDKKGECWLWTASLVTGYGYFWAGKGITYYAHRISWMISRGPIPQGMDVLHNCPGGDNKRCVNPRHLYLGTDVENGRDRREKGQMSPLYGEDHWTNFHPERIAKGEQQGSAKLTEEKVLEIRRLHTRGVHSQRKLARLFGVDRGTIKQVVRRITWKHI